MKFEEIAYSMQCFKQANLFDSCQSAVFLLFFGGMQKFNQEDRAQTDEVNRTLIGIL